MDDDEVAQILANEAWESSVKYSSQGLGAYMPRRPTSGAPKPNTRFLRHLIRDTDTHNLALKRKEEKEALDRMRQLKDASSSAEGSASHTSRKQHRHRRHRESESDRGREHGDGHSSHRVQHPRRSASVDRDLSHRHRRHRDEDEHRDRDERRRHRHRHESSRSDRRERTDDRSRRHRERSYSRSRSHSPRRGRSPERHRSRKYRHRSRSPSRSHLRSPETQRSRRSKRDDESATQESDSSCHATAALPNRSSSSRVTTRHLETGDESDPLEDLVGPLPARDNGRLEVPIRSRGRGAYKHNPSSIDAHFAPDYDPTLDVQLNDDDNAPSENKGAARRPVAGLMTADDDWDMALEALRDRARWKQKGEDRLREAGMNEETIERWKSNPAFTGSVDQEGRLEDVRWTKKGEGREWDRGKVMDDEGHIDVRAAW